MVDGRAEVNIRVFGECPICLRQLVGEDIRKEGAWLVRQSVGVGDRIQEGGGMTENPLQHGLFFRGDPGLPFVPSNGTEGSSFEEAFCETCVHEKMTDEELWCDIHGDALIGEQPKEWIHDGEGIPTCTKYKRSGDGNRR